MKSINTFSKLSILLMLVMLLIVGKTQAQNTIERERIVPVQAGTVTLVNGNAVVPLSTLLTSKLAGSKATYSVTLTPIGDCGALKIWQKGSTDFSVREIQPGTGSPQFDYIVFLKETMSVTYYNGTDPAPVDAATSR